MHKLFKAISLSYRNAPLSIRGMFTLDEKKAKQLMLHLQECNRVSEVLVISTCNRTEVYYSSPEDLSEDIIRYLLMEKDIFERGPYLDYFQRISASEEAVRHLFEVSLGLQSQVVGDMQIINQVKHAYQWSVDLGLAGPFLHRLLHTIFFANKRVIQETAFRDGACSASYATVGLLKGFLQNPKILVVGLGEIGTDVVKNLPSGAQVTLVNRTRSKSDELGSKYGHRVADFEDIENEIAMADVIISSIVTETPFFTKEKFSRTGKYSFQYIIDLSVPISVSPELEDVPGILLYNIDAIRSRTDETLTQRMDAIPAVSQIISESLAEFDNWAQQMVMMPAVQKLKVALDKIRQDELARSARKLSPDELETLELITGNIMQKILKQPVMQLKAACKRGEAETLIHALHDLFNLENKTKIAEREAISSSRQTTLVLP